VRDLQTEAAPFDGVVVADPAFFLDGQDLAGGVVLWQVMIGNEVVGCLERRDAGQRQLLGQPVL
jgi:hypothetical protein